MRSIKNFYEEIKDIKYGWHDKRGHLHKKLTDGNFVKQYKMQKTKNIQKSGYAICWEMCELQRKYFKKRKIEHKTIFVILRKDRRLPCHTFSVVNYNNKWYWFEASWENQKGIHEFNSISEILDFYRDNFHDFTKGDYNKDNMEFYQYFKPLFRMNCNFFYFWCLHGKKLRFKQKNKLFKLHKKN